MLYWLAILLVAIAPVANAQLLAGVSYATPHPAVARVIVPEADGTAYGSGTLIDVRDDYGLVLTNWHVVRDASGPIEVAFPSGFVSQARRLKVDKDWDLAALVIWRPPCKPVELAAHPPRPGDPLTIAGYGSGNYRAVTGRCTQYYAPRLELPQELVELDVQARQGDSGGPIFNQQGELAGVLFGAGKGTTLGSFQRRVQTFLATLAPDIGQDTASQVVSSGGPLGCPGGVCPRGDGRNPCDLGDVCFGCDQCGQVTRQQHEVRPTDRSQPPATAAAEWPEINASPPALSWSSGRPTNSETSGQVVDDATPAAGADTTGSPLVSASLFETVKNVLAIVGVIAILLQVVRLAG